MLCCNAIPSNTDADDDGENRPRMPGYLSREGGGYLCAIPRNGNKEEGISIASRESQRIPA